MSRTPLSPSASVFVAAFLASLVSGCSPPGLSTPPAESPPDDLDILGLTAKGIHGDTLPPKTVILTYDDGPDEHTLEVATYLNQNNIQATFFINGRRICKSFKGGRCVAPMDTRTCGDGHAQAPVADPRYYPPSLLDELVGLGHRVANHTEDHCRLPRERSTNALVFELGMTQFILRKHIHDGILLFRPPYGAWDDATDARARTAQSLDRLVGPVMWDVDGRDYDCWHNGLDVADCGARYLQSLGTRPKLNGIILLHDRPEFNVGYEGPLLLTKWLVPRLRDSGFQFANISDLLDLVSDSTPETL
ncbi:MAG TPA: polysaccharide deacetylase family protein [Polyangia bacterium]|nr:polysaccharide deacetylase family protein [Polyangia bacterium]